MNNKKEIYRVKNRKLCSFKNVLRKKPTKAELILKKKLSDLGIKFTFQKIYFNESFSCIVDFFFKIESRKIVIEVDGGYHSTPEQIIKDQKRDLWLKEKRKCRVLRVTNEMVESNVDNVIFLIAKEFSRLKRFGDKNGAIIKSILDQNKPIS